MIDMRAVKNGGIASDMRSAQRQAAARVAAAEHDGERNVVIFATIAKARISNLESTVAELEAELSNMKIEIMSEAGRDAQVEAFMRQHPNSPLLADSGKRFKSGKIKTKARLIFEAAFDQKGRELGIINPADRRKD
jgi:hypothetical protein